MIRGKRLESLEKNVFDSGHFGEFSIKGRLMDRKCGYKVPRGRNGHCVVKVFDLPHPRILHLPIYDIILPTLHLYNSGHRSCVQV